MSTGGTHRTLAQEGGLKVRQVSEVTGSPEILEGRVKTLHPAIHGGLLARRELPRALGRAGRARYRPDRHGGSKSVPFVETVGKPDVSLADALENIDIGGPPC